MEMLALRCSEGDRTAEAAAGPSGAGRWQPRLNRGGIRSSDFNHVDRDLSHIEAASFRHRLFQHQHLRNQDHRGEANYPARQLSRQGQGRLYLTKVRPHRQREATLTGFS